MPYVGELVGQTNAELRLAAALADRTPSSYLLPAALLQKKLCTIGFVSRLGKWRMLAVRNRSCPPASCGLATFTGSSL